MNGARRGALPRGPCWLLWIRCPAVRDACLTAMRAAWYCDANDSRSSVEKKYARSIAYPDHRWALPRLLSIRGAAGPARPGGASRPAGRAHATVFVSSALSHARCVRRAAGAPCPRRAIRRAPDVGLCPPRCDEYDLLSPVFETLGQVSGL